MNRSFWTAVFMQFMGTIGSGIFVLPYLFYHSNFIFASFFLVGLGLVTALLNQFYVDIVVSTPGDHQLAGYAAKYLGSRYRILTTLNLIFLAFGAIAAYSKLFQSFMTLLIPTAPSSGLFILFFLLLVIFYSLHFRSLRYIGFIVPILMILVPIILFIFSLFRSSYLLPVTLISPSFDFFGATLFALSGFTIIPEVQEILLTSSSSKKKLSKAVLLGLLLTIICYFMFIFGVINLSLFRLTPDTVTGLGHLFPAMAKIISAFGVVVVLRASFGFLIILRELFYRDLFLPRFISSLLPLTFPILTLLVGSISLLTIISATGHITIFISALLICLIRLRLSQNFAVVFASLLILITLSMGLIASI